MTSGETSARRRARALGAEAEIAAALWLEAHGYRVVARGFTALGGELDVIVSLGDTLAFVEVKARATFAQAQWAITERKRRRLSRAARVWVSKNQWAAEGWTLRGDAVCLAPGGDPLHIVDAFALDFEGW